MNSQDVCPTETALDIIGGKWKGMILYHLSFGTKRFNQLMRLMPRITQRMLTTQLRELEKHGIVVRTIYPEVPPKVEYALSELGIALKPVVFALEEWGKIYLDRGKENKCSPNSSADRDLGVEGALVVPVNDTVMGEQPPRVMRLK